MNRIAHTILLLSLLAVSSLSAEATEQPYRIWTSFNGFSIEAQLVERTSKSSVTLIKKDGTSLFVEIEQLSSEDQRYLGELAALEGRPERILFIGNSYTAQIKGMLTQLVAASPYKDCKLSFINPGGKTLQAHFENTATMEKIRTGDWDVVVLQDQSQTPAIFPGKFMEAAQAIDRIIDEAGAMTVFYETWGRRDGDKMNKNRFPTYEAMQEALSDSYAKAARKCEAKLAPVGQAWSLLREEKPELGAMLYRNDGSHPANHGAYLVACVFYATLFGADPTVVDFDSGLAEAQIRSIHAAIQKTIELN